MNVTPEILRKCTDGMANTGNHPSEDDINNVCGVTGIDRAQATILLKKWSAWGDAVTHYFDDPSSAVREDASARKWEPQDNIPFAENISMSRPPSPTGTYVDLSNEHAAAKISVNHNQQDEDEQLKQAMAESMRGMPGQENGTIHAGQQFGPAQQPYYPPSQWALVASSREVVKHPPPTKRRKREGEPSFLRGPPETGYNAPLLTIYHSIPLAREALLFPPLEIQSYGHQLSWWEGSTDENLKSLSVLQSAPGDENRRRYLAELQCLMAFLDRTDRAYGSVDALSDLRHCQYLKAENNYTRFIEAWQTAAMDEKSDEPLTQIFTSVAARGPTADDAFAETKEMFFIEGAVRGAKSQAELLDMIMWGDSANQALEPTWMERFGHIITMRVWRDEPSATELGLVPTEVWYVDRYTAELRERLYIMRQQCQAFLREKERLMRVQLRLAEMPVRPNGSRINIRKALETARDIIPAAALDTTRPGVNLGKDPLEADTQRMQLQIDSLLAEINVKSELLERRRSELDVQIQNIMSDMSEPDHSSQTLRHKYTLQGVSTKPNVTYFRKLNPDLIEMTGEEEPYEMWQWWRTAWGETPGRAPGLSMLQADDGAGKSDELEDYIPFSINKVSVQEVLKAVKTEHSTAVLVYADDTAMNFQPSNSPPALKAFVDQDNRAFEDEISLQHVQQPARSRSWSNETNSTTTDDPFADNTYPTRPTDATPLSTSTIRSLDDQPSPKRPRSSHDSITDATLMDLPPSYEAAAGNGTQEMAEKKVNKIGYFTEQLLQQVDEQQQKG